MFFKVFEALLQPYCLLCADYNGGSHGLCKSCYASLPWQHAKHCPQCALPSDGSICGHCLNASPDFDATLALFNYEYPVDRVLQHYKYKDMLHLANSFANLFVERLAEKSADSIAYDLMIPMPMHAERLRERGFNQALEIARHLSKTLDVPLDYQSCQRIKLTPPQASLPLKDRIKNIRGIFTCNQSLQGLNVVIVDDVMTTGASLNELAKTLKKAGAARVECRVIARTLPK